MSILNEQGPVTQDKTSNPVSRASHFESLIGEPQSRLGEMIEATPACLKIVDRSGTLLTMNPAGLGMIEASVADRVLGACVYDLIAPAYREKFRAFNLAICSGHSGEMEFEIVGLNGTKRSVETFAAPYRLTNGELAHIAITNDITERKLYEQTMAQQRTALEVASRLSALGELSAGVAHEINNPLAIISGYAGALRHELAAGKLDLESLDRDLAAIESTVDRISAITEALRTFSSDQPRESRQVCAISEIITGTLQLCTEKARTTGVSINFSPVDYTVVVNPVQISQVLMNLLSNSLKAIENLDEKWISIRASREHNAVRVEVTDSGPGIEPRVAEQMMTPFFTTKDLGEGTGLGLSLSLGIMRSHDGDLIYDPGSKHTRFVMQLPAEPSNQP